MAAGLVLGVLFAAYMANGDILPGKDPLTNARLPVKLLVHGTLAFSPDQDPFMFEWQLRTPRGETPWRFRSWDLALNGVPLRQLHANRALRDPVPDYYLVKTQHPNLYVTKYGPATGLYALPFFAAVYPFVGSSLVERPALIWYTSKVAASVAVAGSAVLLLLAAWPFLRPRTAIALALTYGLGTCVWSSSSQALWQHGPAGLFLALGTFFLMRREKPWAPLLAGLGYTLAFACRPTAAIALAAVGVYYLVVSRAALLRYALGGLPVLLLLAFYNWRFFGRLLVFGQLAVPEAISTGMLDAGPARGWGLPLGIAAAGLEGIPGLLRQIPLLGEIVGPGAGGMALVDGPILSSARRLFGANLPVGIAGILLSPSRGLLVFSPIMVFAFWGAGRVWRDQRFHTLRPVTVAAAGLLLVVAAWGGWWGGWCYGYRLLLEAVTLLAFLAIPIAERIAARPALAACFAVLLTWSVTVQVLGAFAYDVVGWNNRTVYRVKAGDGSSTYLLDETQARRLANERGGEVTDLQVSVDTRSGHRRLWSLRDSQIVYYLAHFRQARELKREAIQQFLATRG